MMHFNLFLLLFFFKDSLQVAPHVDISSGEIEGLVDKSVTGRQFFSFEGIPYAEPPLGENRFKPPVPKKPWKGCLKANIQYACVQEESFIPSSDGKQTITGSEDCLFINIYTPKLDGNLDVLVYIHGGAFVLGSSEMIQPRILMDRDVVLVSLNYRLGALGFLSTEDDILPGNDGLRDQILALKWIKENINVFGGNPNSITISGTSAGGASVHFHTLSPKSKGLFHRAISSSGCMLNPWTILESPRQKTKDLARIVGCEMEDSKKIVDCLRERSAKQIVAAVSKFQPWEHTPFSPLAPVVDEWSSDPVLPEHPYKLLKEKKVNDVPWILAQMAVEGHCSGFGYYSEKNLKHLDEHWNDLIPHVLHYNSTVKQSDLKTIGEKMRKEYIGDEPLTLKNLNKLLTLIGDRLFNSDFDKAVRLHAAAIKSPVYYYWFNYRGAHSVSEIFTNTNDDLGAAHGDDALYFSDGFFDSMSTESDKAMVKVILDMYLSFAKEGKPSINKVEWTPVSKNVEDQIRYLKIDSPTAIFDEKIKEFGNRKFWDSLPLQENENFKKGTVWHSTPFCLFAPVFDTWSADPVFPQHLYELLKEKKVNDVPWMLGEMAVEGHCNGFEYYSEETLKYLDEHWNELMPHILGYNLTAKASDLQIIGEKIRKEYLGAEVPTIGNLKKLLRLLSDRLFSADFDRSLRMHSTAISSPVYYYLFNYSGAHSYTELGTGTNEDLGATHGDDLLYLTSLLLNSQSTEQDRSMTELIVDIYLSFARNGKPETNQVHWEPVSKMEMDPIKYLKINSPSSLVSGESTQLGNRKFWDSLPFRENKNFKEDEN